MAWLIGNKINGNNGDQTLIGSDGADLINGAGGNDIITGGQGRDILIGGSGRDQFVFAPGDSTPESPDTIIDFKHGTDKIDLSQLAFGLHWSGAKPSAYGVWHDKQSDATFVHADIDGDGIAEFSLQLDGKVKLSGSDFIGVTDNTAPVLDASTAAILPGATVSTDRPAGATGWLVHSLLAGKVSDSDGAGIAITGANSKLGTWWYSTDNGAHWQKVGKVAESRALLLEANSATRVYFQSKAGKVGTADLEFRGWDQTSGREGQKVDVSEHGGSSAFSDGKTQLSLNVGTGEGNGNVAPTGSASGVLESGSEDAVYLIRAEDLLQGYTDANGDSLGVIGLSADHGSIKDHGDGTWSLTPEADYHGPVSLSYEVSDGTAGTSASLSFALAAVNDVPVMSGSQAVLGPVAEDGSVIVQAADLLQGYSDIDGDALSVSGLAADHGTLIDNGDGSWTFTPDSDFNGQAELQYVVTDGHGGEVPATLSLQVSPVNDVPAVTGPVEGFAIEDGAVVTVDALANASDAEASSLSVVGLPASLPAGVSYHADSHSFSLDPSAYQHLAAGETQQVTVAYGISDGSAITSASVVFTVTGSNDAPVAETAQITVAEDDVILNGSVSATDADANATLSVSLLDPVPAGLTFDADGSYSFDASDAAYQSLGEGEALTVTVSYQVTDDQGDSSMADLVISVTGVNDEAVLDADTVELMEADSELDLTASGQLAISDVDSPETFAAQTATAGLYGSFSIDESGAWTYVADGAHDEFAEGEVYADSFEVTSADGTATSVTLLIHGSDDGAVISGTTEADGYEGDTAEDLYISGALDVSDIDSDTGFVAQADTLGAYGSFSIDEAGNWSYVADGAHNEFGAGEIYVESFDVYAVDGTAATVTVLLNGSNDDPVAQDLLETVSEHQGAVTLVAAFDPVDAGDNHTFSFDTADLFGTVIGNGDGSFSYDAGGAFDGLSLGETAVEVFSYTVTDQWGASSTAQVTVTVEGINDGVELVGGSGVRESVDRGSFDFTDPDANDTLHQATAQAALYGATAALVVADTYGLGTQGQVVWSYTLDDAAVDGLADGQSVMDGFDVTVDDFAGGSFTQTISVAIATGTADGDYLDGNFAADPGYQGSFQFGRGGDDVLKANFNDWLDGGDGIDLIDLSGATAPVSLWLETGADWSSFDLAYSGLGTVYYRNVEGVVGSDGDDELYAPNAGGYFFGGAGADNLYGGNGEDWLCGESNAAGAADVMAGGLGADIFDFWDAETWASDDGLGNAVVDVVQDFGADQSAAGDNPVNTGVLSDSADLGAINGDVLMVNYAALSALAGFDAGSFVNPAAGTFSTLGADDISNIGSATEAHAQFVYDDTDGVLYFDADGSGSKAELVAIVNLGVASVDPTAIVIAG